MCHASLWCYLSNLHYCYIASRAIVCTNQKSFLELLEADPSILVRVQGAHNGVQDRVTLVTELRYPLSCQVAPPLRVTQPEHLDEMEEGGKVGT